MATSRIKYHLISLAFAAATFARTGNASNPLNVAPAPYSNTNISQPTLIGGKGNDWLYKVVCGQDKSCLLVGTTIGSFGDSLDYQVIRVDSTGKPLWAKTYGGTDKDTLTGAVASRDGGFLVIGNSNSHFWDLTTYPNGRADAMKINADGKLAWVNLMQNAKESDITVTQFRAAAQTPDGGFILVGSYNKPPAIVGADWPQDVVALKLSSDGHAEWLHHYDFGQNTSGGGVIVESDGRIGILADYYEQDYVHSHPMLFMVSPDGKPLQATEYVYEGNFSYQNIRQQADGKLLMTGEILFDHKPFENKVAALWLTPDGVPQFGHVYSIDAGFALTKTEIFQDSEGLVGHTGSSVAVLRAKDGPENDAVAVLLNPQGDIKSALELGTQHRNSRNFGDSEFQDIAALGDHKFRLVGSTDAFGGGDADGLTTVWTPANYTGSLITISPLEMKTQKINMPAVAGDTSNVKELAPGRVDIGELNIGKANSH